MCSLLISALQADSQHTIAIHGMPVQEPHSSESAHLDSSRSSRWTELSGLVNDHLSAQHIHNIAFHRGVKALLAAMVTNKQDISKKVAVVVGVEHGADIKALLNIGFTVVGFEADRHRYPHLEKMSALTPGRARVHLCGASDQPRKMNITYHGEVFEACLVRIDDYVSTPVSVLSVDIQGQEEAALRGAHQLIKRHGVDMMWIELNPDTCEAITQFLH
eukprot:CAMPEP_0119413678 /NCGR_PEP_ID=MMETSP1335-20130426/5682_1 /TAXON_ID=259385 /ORGANISM="Chrysoculter rhomboideus, Strain RCC1486" /LENGTH=217 /DNA_ID=CAMNT_0007438485 /DNA_START=56 /DNA_END=706 /DNA_ORIENTATION=-